MSLPYHNIDPIICTIGFVHISWYGVSYIIGILCASFYVKILNKHRAISIEESLFEDGIMYIILGIIIGGRLGYVLFYDLNKYLASPLKIIQTWNGGMSFHGGLLGVLVAIYLFTRKHKISFLYFTDYLACTAPIVIFSVRIANFINGELFGRESSLPWAIIFPKGGELPRHPTQLYEALGEGAFIFMIMSALFFYSSIKNKNGMLSSIFLLLYGSIRILLENFREPDAHIGFIYEYFTMGIILSIPMLITGLSTMIYIYKFQKKEK